MDKKRVAPAHTFINEKDKDAQRGYEWRTSFAASTERSSFITLVLTPLPGNDELIKKQ